MNRILLLIDGWTRLHPELFLMQDNARPHCAKETLAEFAERGVHLIFWPPASPDLNPIEMIWDDMKNWIQEHYPERLTYTTLRKAVREAWDSISERRLNELLDEMPARCQAVIDANGMQTKY